MNDLISRATAIANINKAIPEWSEDKEIAIDCLKNTPSLTQMAQELNPTCMDCISRQAAIEIIQSMYPGMPGVPWMRKDWQERYEPYIRTENAIRKLPSVQQEPEHTMEEFMYGQDLGSPEDGSL